MRQGFDMRDKFYEAPVPPFKMNEPTADASVTHFFIYIVARAFCWLRESDLGNLRLGPWTRFCK